MIQYKTLCADEICPELFQHFIRHQTVTKCWRRENGQWIIKDAPFVDDWTAQDYKVLVSCLKNTVLTGGFVYAAFYDNQLKGFVSVEPEIFGGQQRYLDLSSIHTSEDMRNKGIGKALFLAAKDWARKKGAKKLYISAHSAVESQAFYKAMGCVEAKIYHQEHVEKEPFDCQLECSLLAEAEDSIHL
ncbi:GNAT family N-acetyltransferase [Parablautia muri]|uniref:GNAT family N-acetyltransferase n=1 Tax=Parablautia muri TaxID=2320879 RepID=A0A9X5GV05_9FIRM|nr:GNAT family N-acetyltransferase [Parablautia muri]NBJ94647.1 GNAT family N-acetyltransferase [Parablautia muri]